MRLLLFFAVLFVACGQAPSQKEIRAKDSATLLGIQIEDPKTKLQIGSHGDFVWKDASVNGKGFPRNEKKKKKKKPQSYWYESTDTASGYIFYNTDSLITTGTVTGGSGYFTLQQHYNDTTITIYPAWFLVTDTAVNEHDFVFMEDSTLLYFPVTIKGFIKNISVGFRFWKEFLDERQQPLNKKYVVWDVSSSNLQKLWRY